MAGQAWYVGRWRNDSGCFTVLVLKGRTRLHLVSVGYPVSAAHVPVAETSHIQPLANLEVRATAKTLLTLGRRNGITRAARAILRRAVTA